MRTLLVQPPLGTDFGLAKILTGEPLGLECVGGALREGGHEVALVDLRLDRWDVLDAALNEPPGMLGISCSFSTDLYATIEIARYVKQRWPALPIVVGGHHASLLPDEFLFADSGVDAVVIGEGETTAVELLEAIAAGARVSDVRGVRTRANRHRGFQARPPSRSLDDVARADRSLTAGHRRWYHHALQTRSASIETSRGCPFDCTFCSVSAFYGRRAIKRSAASIAREIEALVDHDYLFITDDLAFYDGEVYRELADRLRASGIRKTYSCETRSDLLLRRRALLSRWRELGLDTVFLGVEKIDDDGLVAVRKRTSGGATTNVEAIEVLRSEGIVPMTSFIVDPAWGDAEFDRLEEFVDRLKLPNPAFTVLTPLPGTELFRARERDLVTRDYGFFDVAHAVIPTALPLERFYERFARLYDNVARDARPTATMLLQAARLAWAGDLWCMKKVLGAVNELRDPAAYLKPPRRISAPVRPHPRSPPWRAAVA